MSDIAAIALLIVFGPGLLTYVVWLVRSNRWRDAVPMIEVAIDKAAGVEVPPRNRVDNGFMLFQLVMMTIVGVIVTGLGLFVFISDF
jgi:hypothetical protein